MAWRIWFALLALITMAGCSHGDDNGGGGGGYLRSDGTPLSDGDPLERPTDERHVGQNAPREPEPRGGTR